MAVYSQLVHAKFTLCSSFSQLSICLRNFRTVCTKVGYFCFAVESNENNGSLFEMTLSLKTKNIVVRKRGWLSKYYDKIFVFSQQHEVIQVDPDIPNSLNNDSYESGTWIDVMTTFKESISHEPLEDNLYLPPTILSSDTSHKSLPFPMIILIQA